LRYIDPDGHQTQLADYLRNAANKIQESARQITESLTRKFQDTLNPPLEKEQEPVKGPAPYFIDKGAVTQKTMEQYATGAELTFDIVSTFDIVGVSVPLKLYMNEVSGRGNSKSDYVIGIGSLILTRGKGSGPAKIALNEAKQLVGNWSRSSTFGRNLSNLIKHAFDGHGASVGAKDVWQYLRKAASFNKKGAKREVFENGTRIRYLRKDGTYLITDANGGFISYGRN